ncbi:hypothetical protein QUF54_08655, partial [Candidatus Marithioploca araucensis]|nr:hypothetical protein [Candidatus Marithioploca araucensis]
TSMYNFDGKPGRYNRGTLDADILSQPTENATRNIGKQLKISRKEIIFEERGRDAEIKQPHQKSKKSKKSQNGVFSIPLGFEVFENGFHGIIVVLQFPSIVKERV